MTDSILTSIKKLLGIAEIDTNFDIDIITHINTAFMRLAQLGVGPLTGFRIEDDIAVWSDVITDKQNLESIKTYVFIKVKLLFDPPASASIAETLKQQLSELEWCINVEAETTQDTDSGGSTNNPMTEDGWSVLVVRR